VPRLRDLVVFAGGLFVANEILAQIVFNSSWALPISLTGSRFKLSTAPAGTFTIDINKNGVSQGTVQWTTGNVNPTTITFASAVTWVADDVLTITAPATPDAAAAGLSATLAGA
jgi:hypothetical protein